MDNKHKKSNQNVYSSNKKPSDRCAETIKNLIPEVSKYEASVLFAHLQAMRALEANQ